jgi:hypothetical protein
MKQRKKERKKTEYRKTVGIKEVEADSRRETPLPNRFQEEEEEELLLCFGFCGSGFSFHLEYWVL